MKIPLKDFLAFVETTHRKDVSILLVWDNESNETQILSQGSTRQLADLAAAKAVQLGNLFGLKQGELVEDLRERHTGG
jgi:hypothetical protein